MLVLRNQMFQLYRHGEMVGPFALQMFVPFAGTPILLIAGEAHYLITKIGSWNRELIEMKVARTFSNLDAAIMAYRLSGGV